MAGNVQVTSRIELNYSVLNVLDNAQFEALAQTADATLTELRDRQVMPFDTGNLQNACKGSCRIRRIIRRWRACTRFRDRDDLQFADGRKGELYKG